MHKNERMKSLQTLVRSLVWELPGNDHNSCYNSLTADIGTAHVYLWKPILSGCRCYSVMQIEIRSKRNSSENIMLTVAQGKWNKDLRSLNRWRKETLKRLMTELREKHEQEAFAKIQSFLTSKTE